MLSESWFHSNITGKEAEELLLNEGKDGSFLVRRSLSEIGHFSLSYRQNGTVIHIKIQNAGDYFDLYGGEKFASLADLVQFYVDCKQQLKEVNGNVINLKYPLLCNDMHSERWFHGPLSGKNAENLLMKLGQKYSFLVRECYNKPGYFDICVKVSDTKVVHVKIENLSPKPKEKALYRIEGGEDLKFDSLTQLIDHYSKHGMVDASGDEIYLDHPLYTTKLPVRHINSRITELEKMQSNLRNGFSEEWQQLELEKPIVKRLYTQLEGSKEANRAKNRYKNMLPFDHSRVILRDGEPDVDGADYINASFIQDDGLVVDKSKLMFIASQGCRKESVADFWRMIWQENCQLIVMITQETEKGKNKCERYWPTESQKTLTLAVYNGQIVVNFVSDEGCGENPETPEGGDRSMYRRREMTVTHIGRGKAPSPRTVIQYQFLVWLDHNVPSHGDCVLQLYKVLRDQQNKMNSTGRMVVHCSAGIGRTGTFIVICILLARINERGLECEIDIQDTVRMVRTQRPEMVQTELQYKYIYSVIARHVELLKSDAERRRALQRAVYENVNIVPNKPRKGNGTTVSSKSPQSQSPVNLPVGGEIALSNIAVTITAECENDQPSSSSNMPPYKADEPIQYANSKIVANRMSKTYPNDQILPPS